MPIKEHCSHETHVVVIIQALTREPKWSTVLKQLSPLEDFMFIKKRLGKMQKLKSTAHDPSSCAIKAKHGYFTGWKTIGHILREISQYVYLFIEQEGGRVYGKLKSLKYKPSPTPAGGLEVPPLVKFASQDKWVTDTMEEFVENFYSFYFP